MDKKVILSALRTPIGKFGATLSKMTAPELGAIAIKESVKAANVPAEEIDCVVMEEVLQAAVGQIPSRQATIKAGLPFSVGSETINRVCASSLRAVTLADQMIRSGDVDIVVAGGMESMSNAPYASPSMRWGDRMFNSVNED